MRAGWLCATWGLLAAALAANAQDRKPGLYEVTLTTTMATPSPATYPPYTTQVCLTQAMIDKYGAIVPDNLRSCQVINVVKKPGAMSADISCSGGLTGKGTLEVSWTDSEHTKGHIQFSGSLHPAGKEIKIEWNAETVSVYKGSDCSAAGKAASPQAAPAAPPAR